MKLAKFKDKKINAESIYFGRNKSADRKFKASSISSNIDMGTINFDDPKDIKDCLEKNNSNEWEKIDVKKRTAA